MEPARTSLPSERVIVSAPMSFAGSTQRLWRLTRADGAVARATLVALALVVIPVAWVVVLCWYVLFGLLLVPYRLLRRGARKRRREALMHRERLELTRHP